MNRFNGSFRGLMDWALDSGLIPPGIPIHLQEIQFSFDNRFRLELFPEEARKAGLPVPINPTPEDVDTLWNSLSATQRQQFTRTNAKILAEGIPNLRNELAHPGPVNIVFIARSAIEGYHQAIEVINSLWN